MSGRIVHFELPYDDRERAAAFYGELFGWDLQPVPGMDYSLVSTGPSGDQGPMEPGFINGGMGAKEVNFDTPRVVIDVEDIDSTLGEVESHGGTQLMARTSVGETGWTAYFRDPEGNVVGLWQSAPEG
jgi:predicted enzyme related to lactoylglutathione lyase